MFFARSEIEVGEETSTEGPLIPELQIRTSRVVREWVVVIVLKTSERDCFEETSPTIGMIEELRSAGREDFVRSRAS